MSLSRSFFFAALMAVGACGNTSVDSTANSTTAADDGKHVVVTADPERDKWQQPQELIKAMGDVKGKTVADLFAGDGYMTFKLIEAGANVIAIDNDPSAIKAIEKMKRKMKLGDDRLRTRNPAVGDPGLGLAEADMALCMHHFTKVQDRGGFFLKVRQGLKAPAPVYIVEWLPTQTPVGPPVSERIGDQQMMDELEPAGFTDMARLQAPTLPVPYQYMMIAQDFVPGPDDGTDPGGVPVPTH